MTNNSQVLQNLVKSAQSIEKENERLTSKILKQSLDDLNKSLLNSFNQKLDTTLELMKERENDEKKEIEESIQEQRRYLRNLEMNFKEEVMELRLTPMKYRRTAILISFCLGAAIMAIIFLTLFK